MNAQEIRAAVEAGKTACWANRGYRVIDGGIAGYLIECQSNGHCIGLTWNDGVTLNGKPEEFHIGEEP